ncbi:MAG: prephenate dehydrogenase [Nitrososphaerota archaeon]|nr:prephenate dehydrogenase [Nitrososphaerota archaeon]
MQTGFRMFEGEDSIREDSRLLQKGSLTLAVVGSGGMGRLLSRLLKASVSKLILVSRDPDRARTIAKRIGVDWGGYESVAYTDICIVTVPSRFVVDTVSKISHRLKAGSVIADISSVKTYIVPEVLKILPNNIEYISLHPLFGPSVRRSSKLKVVVIPVKCSDESLDRLVSLLRGANLNIIFSTVEEHDRVMSVIQCIHHLSYMTLALTMLEYVNPEDIARYSTASLTYTLKMLRRFRRILDVVKEIQELNPYYGECRIRFIEYARLLSSMSEQTWKMLRDVLDSLSSIEV